MDTFKNPGVKVGTTNTTVYSCPANVPSAIVQSLYLTNTNSGQDITVIISVYKSTGQSYSIGYNVPIPRGSMFYIDKPINLTSQDILQVRCSATNSCEGLASVMEMTS